MEPGHPSRHEPGADTPKPTAESTGNITVSGTVDGNGGINGHESANPGVNGHGPVGNANGAGSGPTAAGSGAIPASVDVDATATPTPEDGPGDGTGTSTDAGVRGGTEQGYPASADTQPIVPVGDDAPTQPIVAVDVTPRQPVVAADVAPTQPIVAVDVTPSPPAVAAVDVTPPQPVPSAPPKQRSRRGWMSDSPLDGGSGWPTSAYAVVPRPAVSPENTLPREARTPPPPKTPVSPSPSSEQPKGRRGVALLGVLTSILIVALVVVLVVRNIRSTGGPVDGIPAPGVTTGEPAANGVPSEPAGSTGGSRSTDPSGGPSAGASGAPGAGASVDPTATAAPGASTLPAATTVLRSGQVRLTALGGSPQDSFDLDSGTKEDYTAGAQPDVAASTIGIQALNGSRFAPWVALTAPTAAGCAAVPAAQWQTSIMLSALLPNANTCVRTSDGRYAVVANSGGAPVVEGQLYVTYLRFTVWKKPGD